VNSQQVYYALQTVTATHQTTAALEILATCAHPLFARHNYPGGTHADFFVCFVCAEKVIKLFLFSWLPAFGSGEDCLWTVSSLFFLQQSLNNPSTAASVGCAWD
jgi:hypothetical protein